MKQTVIPGSYDPFTRGHEALVRKAHETYPDDHIVVAIATNPEKQYVLSDREKEDVIAAHLQDILLKNGGRVSIERVTGMTYRHLREIGGDDIRVWKGVRNRGDETYEDFGHKMGLEQLPDNEWIDEISFEKMTSDPDHAKISSSLVRNITRDAGALEKYTHLSAKHLLEVRMAGQYRLNVTGEMGSGKSYISQQFEVLGERYGIPVTNIDMDHVWHDIIGTSSLPYHVATRQRLVDTFGSEIQQPDGSINRKKLGALVFDKTEAERKKLKQLNEIASPVIRNAVYRKLEKATGLILLNAALTAEHKMGFLGNNHTLLIKSTHNRSQASERDGDSLEKTTNKMSFQYTIDEKKRMLQETIQQDTYGSLIEFTNDKASDDEIEQLFRESIDRVDVDGSLLFRSLLHRSGIVVAAAHMTVFAEIKQRHETSDRTYHSRQHILDLLHTACVRRDEIDDMVTYLWAILLHDSVQTYSRKMYDTDLPDEVESALYAHDLLQKVGLTEQQIKKTFNMILITRHTWKHNLVSSDQAHFVAADLQVLSRPYPAYVDYVQQIREEYKVYTDIEFAYGRKMFLENMLQKIDAGGSLYPSHFYAGNIDAKSNKIVAWMAGMEKTARINMQQELAGLQVHIAYQQGNIGGLLEHIDAGERINVTYGADDSIAKMLSNLAPSDIEIDGETYASVEAFWQSLKFPESTPERDEAKTLSGLPSKKHGNKAPDSYYVWYRGNSIIKGSPNHHRLMHQALYAKFTQHPDLRDILLATGQKPIVHALYNTDASMHSDSTNIPARVFTQQLMLLRAQLAG